MDKRKQNPYEAYKEEDMGRGSFEATKGVAMAVYIILSSLLLVFADAHIDEITRIVLKIQ